MAYKVLLVPRKDHPEESLTKLLAELQTRDTLTVQDLDGDIHDGTVLDVTLTPRGIEATLDLSKRKTP
jgi:hypothetical protein